MKPKFYDDIIKQVEDNKMQLTRNEIFPSYILCYLPCDACPLVDSENCDNDLKEVTSYIVDNHLHPELFI